MIYNLQKTIASQPKAVKQLFLKYGVKKQPTLENVLHLYNIAGEPFLLELYNAVDANSNAEGQPTAAQLAMIQSGGLGWQKQLAKNISSESQLVKAQQKNQGWNNFKSWFNTALGNFNTTATNVNQLASNIKGNTQPELDKFSNIQDTTPDKKKDNTLYIIGGVLLAVVIIILIFKNKK